MKKVAFIHINKTGGSSIERALGLPFEHKTALEKRAELGEENWLKRFRFTIVRNPWDKVVSHYFYRVKTNQTGLADNPIDFNTWVKRTYGEQDPLYYDKAKMFMPQWQWITDEHGELMVKFIGRFERLEQDFQRICRRIRRQASLPHIKKSNRGHYRQYYNDESIEIIRRWFAGDIAYFGYEY